jgi:hypothetical protein
VIYTVIYIILFLGLAYLLNKYIPNRFVVTFILTSIILYSFYIEGMSSSEIKKFTLELITGVEMFGFTFFVIYVLSNPKS